MRGRERLLLKEPADLQLFDIAGDGRLLIATVNWRGETYSASHEDRIERDLSWLDFSVLDDVSADGRTFIFHEAGDGGGAKFSAYLRSLDGGAPLKLTEGECLAFPQRGIRQFARRLNNPTRWFLCPPGLEVLTLCQQTN